MQELADKVGLTATADMHELYVDLLCEFAPHDVLPYLSSWDEYPLDICLKKCQEHEVMDATAFLLERTGNIPRAMELLLAAIEDNLRQYQAFKSSGKQYSRSTDPDYLRDAEYSNLEHSVLAAISLCKRNSIAISSAAAKNISERDGRERDANGDDNANQDLGPQLWFSLLNKFLNSQSKLTSAEAINNIDWQIRKEVLEVVIGFMREVMFVYHFLCISYPSFSCENTNSKNQSIDLLPCIRLYHQ